MRGAAKEAEMGSSIPPPTPTEGVTVDDDNDEINEQSTRKPTANSLKDRKLSWTKLRRVDSLNLEAGTVSGKHTGGGHGNRVCTSKFYHCYSTNLLLLIICFAI